MLRQLTRVGIEAPERVLVGIGRGRRLPKLLPAHFVDEKLRERAVVLGCVQKAVVVGHRQQP